jgi:choline dehydrogenase-like flavoprotein
MGTTRMHADPRQGVVDAQCQVHGVGNLYVAGSSTFPAGGYANPTLTLVALALRLADHLKTRPDLQAARQPRAHPSWVRSNAP